MALLCLPKTIQTRSARTTLNVKRPLFSMQPCSLQLLHWMKVYEPTKECSIDISIEMLGSCSSSTLQSALGTQSAKVTKFANPTRAVRAHWFSRIFLMVPCLSLARVRPLRLPWIAIARRVREHKVKSGNSLLLNIQLYGILWNMIYIYIVEYRSIVTLWLYDYTYIYIYT